MNIIPIEALQIMDMRFGCDSLISIATTTDNVPYVRAVNAYYEGGAFYFITNARSNKMEQIRQNPLVAICGEWFTGHGIAENLGHILSERNSEIYDKLTTVFEEWYDNGHIDETDTNTIIVRVRLATGILYSEGTRYDLKFN